MIGAGEVLLGIAIATGLYRKRLASIQILLVITMNILEFNFAVDKLLWGPLNIIFALVFCFVVYWNGFILNKHADVESN